MSCICIVSFAVILNGQPGDKFAPFRVGMGKMPMDLDNCGYLLI